VATLKSRLSGKKVKGALLTPGEMEELTETWKTVQIARRVLHVVGRNCRGVENV